MTTEPSRGVVFAALGALLVQCTGVAYEEEHEAEQVGRLEQALNVCHATIDPRLVVDGIPAYQQCSASNDAAIYSNNGIDTSTSAISSDWKRTQFSGGYQCTELIRRYWLFVWDVSWVPNGNAGTWCDTMPPRDSGIVQTTTPVHGDAIVFAPGVCGADGVTGHVALVDTVNTANSTVTFIEQNRASRRTSDWSCATCFLHVEANDGSGSVSVVSPGGAADAGMPEVPASPSGSSAPTMANTSDAPTATATSTAMGEVPPPVPMPSAAPTAPTTPPEMVRDDGTGGVPGVAAPNAMPAQPSASSTTASSSTTAGGETSIAAPMPAPGAAMPPSDPSAPSSAEADPAAGCHLKSRGPVGAPVWPLLLSAALLVVRRPRRPRDESRVLIERVS